MNAKDLEKLIAMKFSGDAWAFLPQVSNGTAGFKDRTADALVMGLWPSRGLHLYGFEIKVNRGDWLNELKNPQKAEEIAKYCDFWYIVAPEGIVKTEELPQGWGLMTSKDSGALKIIKPAPKLESVPVSKPFLAAILRKAEKVITPYAEIQAAEAKGYQQGLAAKSSSAEWEARKHETLKRCVKEFEDASGITLNTWRGNKETGEAVRFVLDGQHLHAKEDLSRLLKTSEKITEDIKKSLNDLVGKKEEA